MHVGARDPLRVALRDGGSAFVLVHNHPSGDPSASREDLRFTEQVAEAADVIGVPLLDHVIVARGGYLSMLDHGVLRSGSAEPPSGGLRSPADLHVPAGASSAATASLAEGWQRFT